MKITIAEVKRRLSVGTEFTGEFIGKNRLHAANDMVITRRRVKKQTSQMVSTFLTGPKIGNDIYLQWAGLAAELKDGAIIISDEHQGEFLKITI